MRYNTKDVIKTVVSLAEACRRTMQCGDATPARDFRQADPCAVEVKTDRY